MREANSLNHTRRECKYHVVFIQKYRKKVLFRINGDRLLSHK